MGFNTHSLYRLGPLSRLDRMFNEIILAFRHIFVANSRWAGQPTTPHTRFAAPRLAPPPTRRRTRNRISHVEPRKV